ncbi:MAG: endonuclease MutS2 [Clostridia bacterium]|nr:endonuclease MutS2 [Clostridia bacterium]
MDNAFEHQIKILELDNVLTQLAEEAVTDDGKLSVLSLRPSNDIEHVKTLLSQTDTAYKLLARYSSPSFGNAKNVGEPLERARRQAALGCAELLEIGTVLKSIRNLKSWQGNTSDLGNSLSGYFNTLTPNKYLEDKIFSAIAGPNEVADNASDTLYDIRRKIVSKAGKIRETLEKIVRSSQAKYLQDAVITQREGRFVVPVKQEYKSEIKGIVHGTSSSGSTLFIEPIAVLETNNEIRVLEAKEADEIARILAELSAVCGEFADSILSSYEALISLDVIFARAKYAYKSGAVLPTLNDKGNIYLKRARHPLISKKSVVPITVELGVHYDSLIITGPNTGGKTVTLKTIGLLTLMTMCGMMIPADDGSTVSIFNKVFADIGDEQSIAQSLSTFSSHMVNIVKILNEADDKTLVLLDELCAGTDPVEGAALAKAIIIKLLTVGAKTAVTTHFPELKAFAIDTERVENASCEFDVKTLKPTYRLIVGVPGRSNAFAISSRLGISEDIIAAAKAQLSDDDTRFERVVSSLQKARYTAEHDAEEIAAVKAKLSGEKKRLEELEKEFELKKQKTIDNAREQATQILERTRRESAALLNELEDIKKQLNVQNAAESIEKARAAYKHNLKNIEENADPVVVMEAGERLDSFPNVDETVFVTTLSGKATVLKTDQKGNRVYVSSGAVRLWVPFDDLRKANTDTVKSKRAPRTVTGVTSRENRSVPGEIDIRGMASDEAIIELDRYIDNAVLSGITDIRIIHGKGTGILRKAVQDHLKRHKSIKSYRLGVFGEGENGVTVAKVKY